MNVLFSGKAVKLFLSVIMVLNILVKRANAKTSDNGNVC